MVSLAKLTNLLRHREVGADGSQLGDGLRTLGVRLRFNLTDEILKLGGHQLHLLGGCRRPDYPRRSNSMWHNPYCQGFAPPRAGPSGPQPAGEPSSASAASLRA